MSTISYRLDLVINLIDTTTGTIVNEVETSFLKGEMPLSPVPRDEGIYILMNTDRQDFDLTVKVKGYEDYRTRVAYETLDERVPLLTAYLIPKPNNRIGVDPLFYRDRIPKLEAIEAITLFKPSCFINEYNARYQVMTIFKSDGNKNLTDVHYGLLKEEEGTFAHIEIKKNVSDTKLELAKPLETDFSSNAPMYRIVFGNVYENGNFLLSVRSSAEEVPCIIRYKKNEEWYSLKCDFRSLTEGSLKKAKKVKRKEET